MQSNKWILAFAAITTAAVANGQTTWHVDGGNACPGTGTQVDPFCLIQAGIDAAVNDDDVVVQSGTYAESIDFDGKAITVRSSSGDPADTIIDGTGHFHVVQCVNGEGPDSVLSGFTITGGNANGKVFLDSVGGGFLCDESSPTVTHCIFHANIADLGGGMYNDTSSPAMTNCIFVGNTATNPLLVGGGGAYSAGGSPTFTNCAFSGNSANSGGAMYSNASNVAVTQCSFSGNSAAFGGAAILNNFGELTITNSVLWGNTGEDLSSTAGAVLTVSFSNIQGGSEGTGNVDGDPLFVDVDGADDILGTPDDDLRLQSCMSPCFNGGDNTAIPVGTTIDLDGNPRLLNLTVDMGAYELDDDGSDDDQDGFPNDCDDCPAIDNSLDTDGDGVADCYDLCPATPPVPVDSDGCPSGIANITTGVAYKTIQLAIDDSVDGHEIVCQPGTYFEAISFLGKTITLRSASGNPADTVIDGSGSPGVPVVRCIFAEGAATLLEGFTITGGSGVNGGGMRNTGSSPTVRHCIFIGNSAAVGGGMFNQSDSSPTVTHCIFIGNSASLGGGMVNNPGSSPTVSNSIFIGNSADERGGGIRNDGDLIMNHCMFSGNSATLGGGIYHDRGRITASNCTFSGNSASGNGGAIGNGARANLNISNSIFWDNIPNEIHDFQDMAVVNYSNILGGYAGNGNIDNDPFFVDANGADNLFGTPDDDLQLQTGSPCIDAGNSVFVPFVFPNDLANNARIIDDPATVDTGVGFPEVVDMGAYEFGSIPAPCRSSVEGDINCDGIVDLEDFASFMLLFTGPF